MAFALGLASVQLAAVRMMVPSRHAKACPTKYCYAALEVRCALMVCSCQVKQPTTSCGRVMLLDLGMDQQVFASVM